MGDFILLVLIALVFGGFLAGFGKVFEIVYARFPGFRRFLAMVFRTEI